MPGSKLFASKPKLEKINMSFVNKTTSVSERRHPQSNKLGLSSCEKHNLGTSNKTIYGTSVDTEINVVDKNFCNGESYFTQEWNTVVILNLLCGFVSKNTICKHCNGDITFVEGPSRSRGIVIYLLNICRCDDTAYIKA